MTISNGFWFSMMNAASVIMDGSKKLRYFWIWMRRPCRLLRFAFALSLHLLQACFGRFVFSGWRIRHSLYHCKLVMYGSQKNWNSGQKFMVLKILGQMFKHGYTVPNHAFSSWFILLRSVTCHYCSYKHIQ